MSKLGDFVRCKSTTTDADIARLQYHIERQRLQIAALMAEVHLLKRHRNLKEKLSGRK